MSDERNKQSHRIHSGLPVPECRNDRLELCLNAANGRGAGSVRGRCGNNGKPEKEVVICNRIDSECSEGETGDSKRLANKHDLN